MSKGRPPKYDYDNNEFYDEIFFLAFNDTTDSEIAYSMGLTEAVFNQMKNGKYDKWSDDLMPRERHHTKGVGRKYGDVICSTERKPARS